MIDLSLKSEVLEVSVNSDSFNGEEAEQLRQQLRGVNRPAFQRVRINFSEVGKMDASGIGPLLSAARELSAADKPVVLVQPGPEVRSMLELLKLSNAFEIQNQ